MGKTLTEMAVEIATAQSSHSAMSADEIQELLKKTFRTLKDLEVKELVTPDATEGASTGEQESGEAGAAKAVDIEPSKSIQRNKVICLECGREFKQITNRHLKYHGLDSKAYRKKWGLPGKTALAARNLTAQRRRTATELRLGERLKEFRKMTKEAAQS